MKNTLHNPSFHYKNFYEKFYDTAIIWVTTTANFCSGLLKHFVSECELHIYFV